MITLRNNLLFLGSRLGDSMLIQYSEKSSYESENDGKSEEVSDELEARPEKRQKIEDTKMQGTASRSFLNIDANNLDEETRLEMMLSGSKTQPSQLVSYQFTVCDSVLNLGPIGNAVIGESFDHASGSHMVSFYGDLHARNLHKRNYSIWSRVLGMGKMVPYL